jgi:hypothetical protein
MVTWMLVVLYFGFPLFGFSYWEKHPAKWHELTEEQQWYYGRVAMTADLKDKIEFTPDMMQKWMRLNIRFKAKYRLK